jgi:hypothetical protein
MSPAGKEKALRRTGLSPKFLSRSSATNEFYGNATTTSSICSDDVKCNRQGYINIRCTPTAFQLFAPFQASFEKLKSANCDGVIECSKGDGVIECSRTSITGDSLFHSGGDITPLYIFYICSARQRPRALLLRLEKLRVSRYALARALTSCAETRSRWFSKLAVPKEYCGSSRALVVTAASSRTEASNSFSRGKGGLL